MMMMRNTLAMRSLQLTLIRSVTMVTEVQTVRTALSFWTTMKKASDVTATVIFKGAFFHKILAQEISVYKKSSKLL